MIRTFFFPPYIPFQDDDTKRPVEMCSLETYPLQNANGNEAIIIADPRHIQRRSERKIVPMLRKRGLDFLCNFPVTPEHLRSWTLDRIPGILRNLDDLETNEFADVLGTIVEDLHLTRCVPVCFTGTEDEQHDHGTIDEVLGNPDMDQGGDAAEEADREAHLPEHIPLPSLSESRPCTFNHEVGINVFEISDSIDMCASTPGAVRMGVAYVQVRFEKKSDCSSPLFRTRLRAFVCLRLVTSGWLAQTCSIRPTNA